MNSASEQFEQYEWSLLVFLIQIGESLLVFLIQIGESFLSSLLVFVPTSSHLHVLNVLNVLNIECAVWALVVPGAGANCLNTSSERLELFQLTVGTVRVNCSSEQFLQIESLRPCSLLFMRVACWLAYGRSDLYELSQHPLI